MVGASAEQQPLTQLCAALRDGQALCRAANAIAPGSVSAKVSASKMTFHQLNNITAFLRAAKTFGVAESECFEVGSGDDVERAECGRQQGMAHNARGGGARPRAQCGFRAEGA